MNIILASASPRRRELLSVLGIEYKIDAADIEENIVYGQAPEKLAMNLAEEKAEYVASKYKDALIIGADTIVVYRGKVLGKPKDTADAVRMLNLLSGSMHEVITGLCVIDVSSGMKIKEAEITKVYFDKLNQKEIERYIATGEPFDKAGAYGIQGAIAPYINHIDGCYYNVVGLPLSRLRKIINHFDIEI